MIVFSVVIPLYNQKEQLRKTLQMFGRQKDVQGLFEVIVVNDGSTDISDHEITCLAAESQFPLRFLGIPHGGSAAARNAGVSVAEGEYIVFCDADRFPDEDYLRAYLSLISAEREAEKYVFQGRVKDCFAVRICVDNLQEMVRLSRDSQYYRKIMNFYAGKRHSSSELAWLSYLVGNSCIHKTMFQKAGMFDEQFSDWGFEHFDLGLRLMLEGATFFNAREAVNYHIPHSKGQSEYRKLFNKSADIMNDKYPQYKGLFSDIPLFLCGQTALQELETRFYGRVCAELQDAPLIYYKL